MSSKWRALQRRHRYTYTAVIFPERYVEGLASLPSSASALRFFSELAEFVSLDSIHSQVSGVKKLSAAFGELVNGGPPADAVSLAAQFYLEILFLENSLPLHRTLISVLAKARNFHPEISCSFRQLCDKYGVLGGKGKRFSVCRAALSALSHPKLGFMVDTIEACAVSVALDVTSGLNSVIQEVNEGVRLSPVVMEQCQEAMSCLYYLLQRFPSKFLGEEFCNHVVPKDSNVFGVVLSIILKVLKSSSFSRDCLVAAGVSFFAALQVCMDPRELATFIVKGIFSQPDCNYAISYENGLMDLELKIRYKGELHLEANDLSVLSRLCLLRGILTAVPRTVLNTHFMKSTIDSRTGAIWTILYNGILPELCGYCENPIDSHFNFHALTVTQICLQQIKTLLLVKLGDVSGDYDPFPEEMVNRIIRIIWNNLEDPLNQTVKQVHLVFDLLLDIHSTISSLKTGATTESFLQTTTKDLLRLGARCKGRYVPLASLTKRLGAKAILQINPNLLFETSRAYVDDDVCCAATSFLKCLLECLRDECWNNEGIERGYISFRSLMLPPILYGLVSGDSKLRSNLNTYALPVLLDVDVDSVFPMLAFLCIGTVEDEKAINCPEHSIANLSLTTEQKVAALVSVLKVARSVALIDGDIDWFDDMLPDHHCWDKRNFSGYAIICMKGVDVRIPVEWLVLALTHVEETLRVDAAEALFLNPKTASLPSQLELSLMKVAVPLNMRCSSTAFQMKWSSLFKKFFYRVRTTLERQVKQGSWLPLQCPNSTENGINVDTKKVIVQRAEYLFQFMKWLSCFLFFSCYPSAPYERKIMAMELILIMIKVWPILPQTLLDKSALSSPYSEGFTSPDSTLTLVGSIVDSWDRLREGSFQILSHYPTPIPGIISAGDVKELITWAKKLVSSPRVRESDAGALTFRLIFRKYVLDLGWVVRASDTTVYSNLQMVSPSISEAKIPVIEYMLSLIDWLKVAVEEGEKDLSAACSNSFVHGVLLTLRYTFEELDWDSEVVIACTSEMREALEMLLKLVMRITTMALWVVSADAWYLPDELDSTDDSFSLELSAVMDAPNVKSELQTNSSKGFTETGPSDQVVMVACWLAMKEISLLLGTIIRKLPLPTCTVSNLTSESFQSEVTMLDLVQLESIGNHFLEVLLKMKHNGAIDKTRAGFTALCNRLLCSNEPRLCKMTESWLEQLMERTVANGQTVDDLLRRSAGIPAAFIALFLSEPEGTPKKLLPRALRWLIDVANRSLPPLGPSESDKHNQDLWKNSSVRLARPFQEAETAANCLTSKVRHEGVIPTVHSFNVLRAAFNDTNLATDTSGFCAEALIIAIRSFSSPYWEVRNSACLAFTALVRRMIGFLNVHKRESARRALTGLEFFHRYPSLHPFLFKELKIATGLLGSGDSLDLKANVAQAVHPSLCPILILLSRLKPSAVCSESKDFLDPYLFMPCIRTCATQSNFRIRVLASRALTGLVSNEKLQFVLQDIVIQLPESRNYRGHSCGVTSDRGSGLGDQIPQFASFNSIHGLLLQLGSLLDNNCRNLHDMSMKGQILGEILQMLEKRSWIGNPHTCPCPTLNGSYLTVLDLIMDVARACGMSKVISSARTLLLELSPICLGEGSLSSLAFFDPTKAKLQKQAAASYFNSVSVELQCESEEDCSEFSPLSSFTTREGGQTSDVCLDEKIKVCLFNSSYEVRLATLKWLDVYVRENESGGAAVSIHLWARINLHPTLIQLLTVEEHPKGVCYVLRVLFTWNLLQFHKPCDQVGIESIYVGTMDVESLFQFWDKLLSLNRVMTHMKTREALLRCMGICMRQFGKIFYRLVCSKASDCERCSDIYECLRLFISFVKQCSASSEPANMRKAAAESMVASGLLEGALITGPLASDNDVNLEELQSGEEMTKATSNFDLPNAISLYACRILDLWFICIKLLEDEDVGLRQSLATDIQKCFVSKGSELGVPAQVEKVIELSFDFLSSTFGHWIIYFDRLMRWIFHYGNFVMARGDLVRQVFDKEIDNHHEERLLLCQLCCSQMGKLPISKSWTIGSSKETLNRSNIVILVQKWRVRFLQQLKFFISNFLHISKGNDWIGGVGNHKDAFVSLYSNLLGLYCLSQNPFDNYVSLSHTGESDPLLVGLIQLRDTIKPFLRNPLIYNLYFLVIQSHEKMLGANFSVSDSDSPCDFAGWGNFDPYFLLK